MECPMRIMSPLMKVINGQSFSPPFSLFMGKSLQNPWHEILIEYSSSSYSCTLAHIKLAKSVTHYIIHSSTWDVAQLALLYGMNLTMIWSFIRQNFLKKASSPIGWDPPPILEGSLSVIEENANPIIRKHSDGKWNYYWRADSRFLHTAGPALHIVVRPQSRSNSSFLTFLNRLFTTKKKCKGLFVFWRN